MQGMREDPRVFTPDKQGGPETSPQGFIPVTYDQCAHAFEQVKEYGGQASLQAIAEKIDGSPRSFDILESMREPALTDKFYSLLSGRIKGIRRILKTYVKYREELARIATQEDRSSTYEDIASRLNKGTPAVVNYFTKKYPKLAQASGVTLKFASGRVRRTSRTRRISTPHIGEQLVGAENEKRKFLVGTENEQFEQLGTIIRDLYPKRSSIAKGVAMDEIAQNLFLMREGAKAPVKVDSQYIRTLFARTQWANKTLHDELTKIVIDL